MTTQPISQDEAFEAFEAREKRDSQTVGRLADALIDRMGVTFTLREKRDLRGFLVMHLWHDWPASTWNRISDELHHESCGPLCPKCGDARDTSVCLTRSGADALRDVAYE